MNNASLLGRAQGCLLGQLAGDALGSLVEFQSAAQIRRRYQDGVRQLVDGGTWNTIAGQPTDDSELALLLARMLLERGEYDTSAALEAYRFWIDSGPFDCGMTIGSGLRGNLNQESQANGALMRISPLGILGARFSVDVVAKWARQDAQITHPHPICQEANALYVAAIANAVRGDSSAEDIYQQTLNRANAWEVPLALLETIERSVDAPPADYQTQQGWVLIAFGNALWQLLHAPNAEEGIVDTVMRGGDTDTNAAIAGALLGAIHGVDSLPSQWVDKLLHCRPRAGDPGVHRPRPECFWPVDALIIAEEFVTKPVK